MKAGWQNEKLGDVRTLLNHGISPKHLKSPNTVRPELVEGQELRPTFIEGPSSSDHGSTSSPRTDGEALDDGNKL